MTAAPWTVQLDGSTSNADRRQLCDQLAALGFDPVRVPVRSPLTYDPATHEVIAVYHARPLRVDPITRDVVTIRIRRRVVLVDVIAAILDLFTEGAPA